MTKVTDFTEIVSEDALDTDLIPIVRPGADMVISLLELATRLGAGGGGSGELDADLAAIAALSPAVGAILIRGASGWTARALVAGDIPALPYLEPGDPLDWLI